MKLKFLLVLSASFVFVLGSQAATQLLFDGFETYKLGRLDANDPGGPNATTNNPWAGPFAADANNCFVVGTETNNSIVVTPHSGTNMVRGETQIQYFDQDYYNLGFLLNTNNGGAAFTGNIYLDWWFFDQVGKGTNGTDASGYSDFIALACYSGIPTNQSYDPNLANNPMSYPPLARLSIGGAPAADESGGYTPTNLQSGFSKTNYQAMVLNNTTNGYSSPDNFANLPVVRSVGWHHARIEVGPRDTNSNNFVKFYVDNLTNAVMTAVENAPSGYNCIEINGDFNTVPAYFDDISFGTLAVAPFSLSITNVGGSNCVVSWTGTHVLQSATILASTNFTDVLNGTNFVTSPYTNSVSGTSRFFRLRN